MEYRTLGNDLTVSAVGLGCMGMSHAYGAPANKKEMTELLAQAVGMGYTFFDTAEVYGTSDNPHDNEELVGAALKLYRDKIVLATKFGIHFDMTSTAVNKPLMPDSRPEVIRASVDASLKRLGTDHIDLYKDSESYLRAVTSTIGRIRQKMEDDKDHPRYIKTVSNIGYQFVPSSESVRLNRNL